MQDKLEAASKIVAVFGGTGRQGGTVAHQLLERGWQVRAITRNPYSRAAHSLTRAGAEVVQGDMDDARSLHSALEGAYGVFSMQPSWAEIDKEVARGKAIADAAIQAGVSHIVYGSVASARGDQRAPAHFRTKGEVERTLEQSGIGWTFLRPVMWMEMFTTTERVAGKKLSELLWACLLHSLRPEDRVQLVALHDLGRAAVAAFENPQAYQNQIVELASDAPTLNEMQQTLARHLPELKPVPAVFRTMANLLSPELRANFRFLAEGGWQVNIAATRLRFPGMLTFDQWLVNTTAAPVMAGN